MAIVTALCDAYKRELLMGLHSIDDDYRMALYGAEAQLSGMTTEYSSAGEVSGDGYRDGGIAIPNVRVDGETGNWFIDFDPAWGGEVLHVTPRGARRLACLRPFALPGGDAAARDGHRALAGVLAEVGAHEGAPADALRFADLARSPALAPRTTSAGRLFDAVSALCGLCPRASYEGQAPMRLEGAVTRSHAGTYPFTVAGEDGEVTVHWRNLIEGVVSDARRGVPAGTVARRFHDTLAAAVLAAVCRLVESHGARPRSRRCRGCRPV